MKIKTSILYFIKLITILCYSQISIATSSCGNVFSGALQTHYSAPNGKITFNCSSKIINNPNNVLNTVSINNPSNGCGYTCTTSNCQATGQPAATLDVGNFQYNQNGQNVTISQGGNRTFGSDGTTDYATINVNQGSTITFVAQQGSTVYRIKSLNLGQSNTANFAPGDYWIENLVVNQGSTINITDNGTARLMLLNSATINQGGMNNSNAANAAKNLFIYSYSDFTLNQGNTFKGFIYAEGNVLIRQGNVETGAINAKNITLDQGANITYDPVAAAELDLGGVCNFIPTLTGFTVQHNATGSYCVPSPITISAYNGSTLVTNFDGSITLNTGTGKGTWSILSGHGQLVQPTANSGIAYYTFSTQDNGQASFDLLYTDGATAVDPDVQLRYNSNIHDDDSDGLINFTANTFLLTAAPIPTPMPPIQNIVRYSDTQIAGIVTPIYITAYGANANLSCGIITSYAGNKAIQFWQNYINPTSGTLTTTVNGTAIGTNSTNPVSVNLNFTNGSSSFNSLYRDVGMIQLNAADNSMPAQTIAGNTNNYVVKPAKLAITNVPNNPGATDASGGVFIKAGNNFTVEVTVQDNDGNATPNYGYELVPARIKLFASTLVAPTGGLNGSLNDGSLGYNTSFTRTAPGVFRGTQFYFDEVGIIKLTAMVATGDYLGTGNVSGPESQNIGRFIPDHFVASANIPIFNSGCTSGRFTYIGQPFTYNIPPIISITAQSSLNNTTQNYRNTFWKMAASNITTNYNSNSPTATLNSTNAANAITIAQTNNGLGTIQLGDGGGLNFNKITNTNIPAFNAEISANINILDSDGVTYLSNPYIIGNTQPNTGISFNNGNTMLQGRISLNNNFGSELLPLTIPVQIQYFNGTDYITNTTDNCTAITDPANISLTPNPSSLVTTPSLGSFANGIGQINLSPPNQTGNVDVTIDLSTIGANLPYLQHNWPQYGTNENFTDNPMAKGTFGIYHGNDQTIYTNEVLK